MWPVEVVAELEVTSTPLAGPLSLLCLCLLWAWCSVLFLCRARLLEGSPHDMRSENPVWTAGPLLRERCLPVFHLTFMEQSSHASQAPFVPDLSLCNLPLRSVSHKHCSSKHSPFICLLIFKVCVSSVDCFYVFILMAAPGLDFVDQITM